MVSEEQLQKLCTHLNYSPSKGKNKALHNEDYICKLTGKPCVVYELLVSYSLLPDWMDAHDEITHKKTHKSEVFELCPGHNISTKIAKPIQNYRIRKEKSDFIKQLKG